MRPIKDTISLEDARTIVHESLTRIERIERVVLSEANGRVLAADVVSNRDVPPFARAAMDGYAVVAEDTFGASRGEPVSLRRVTWLAASASRSPPARRCPQARTPS
jgi:molybdopterin biosynthesis enzyme